MIDAIDRKILHHVQRDNLLTSARLSELVGLSQTSVQRRLARLRATKAIEADIAVVSPEAVGRPLTMLIAVELSAYYVTGETDFMLIVSAKDMQDYEAFTRDFFYNNPDIKGFKTTVVMNRIKASFTLPV